MPTKLSTATTVNGAKIGSDNNDGTFDLEVGPAGSRVNALRVSATGAITTLLGIGVPTLSVRDEKADGTQAGVAVASSHQTRTLNTVVENTITGASLAANRVTLPAGTYRVWASAPHNNADSAASTAHKIRLRNITAGTTTAIGASAGAYNYNQSDSCIVGFRFTIGVTSDFEIQHWINFVGSLNYGLGRAATAGSVEIYAQALFVREA